MSKTNNTFKIAYVDPSPCFNVRINGGSKDGIKENQRFLIYSFDGESIFDPDTGAFIGNLEITKGTGRATMVQDHMTTVTSDGYRQLSSVEKTIKSAISPFGIHSAISPPDEIQVSFEDVKIGDYAKPI